MRNATIRTKFFVGFGFILVLIIVLNAFSLANIRKTSNQVKELYNGTHMEALASVALTQELFRMESAVQHMVLDGSTAATESIYQAARAAVDADLAIIGSDVSAVDAVKSALTQIDAAYSKVTQAVTGGNETTAHRMIDEFQDAVSAAEKTAQALSAQCNDNAEAYIVANEKYVNQVIFLQDIIFVLIVVLSVTTALKLSTDIARPVRRVAAGVAEIAEGRLGTRMESSSGDEIGKLTVQLNDTMETISTYVTEIDEVLDQIGGGNIDLAVEREYVGDFNSIKNSLNRIVAALNRTMHQIRSSCDQVRAGSEQLATNAERLTQGAEEQSSALEEFEASLHKVAELTAGDAENAAAVKKISEEAAGRVMDSSRQMGLMMDSMQEINRSSSDIAKVIKIIEDIAFQTNILALNAAVEAARAGAAGKGFAVVADEVRNLASKSAEASKSTSEMIGRAMTAVDGGMHNAKASEATLSQLKGLVEQMADRLSAIDQSTAEQDRAFDGMMGALTQISSVVHANSDAASENSAASEELASQAEMLDRLVAKFRLKQEQV